MCEHSWSYKAALEDLGAWEHMPSASMFRVLARQTENSNTKHVLHILAKSVCHPGLWCLPIHSATSLGPWLPYMAIPASETAPEGGSAASEAMEAHRSRVACPGVCSSGAHLARHETMCSCSQEQSGGKCTSHFARQDTGQAAAPPEGLPRHPTFLLWPAPAMPQHASARPAPPVFCGPLPRCSSHPCKTGLSGTFFNPNSSEGCSPSPTK